MTRPKPDKQPSCTSRVEAALKAADDFLTTAAIRLATGLKAEQVTASLVHLRKYEAADFMSEGDQTFWYATPETDKRTKKCEERIVEEPGSRKPRKRKVRPIASPEALP